MDENSTRTEQDSTIAPFQCGNCNRRYKRVDHLARHVRSHTRYKPYQCHLCPKAFGRADLLERHAQAHNSPIARDRHASSPTSTTYFGRVAQACRACAGNHLRCTEYKPCRRCTDKGLQCEWTLGATSLAATPMTVQPIMSLDGRDETYSMDSTDVGGRSEDPLGHRAQAHTLLGIPDVDLRPGQWTPMGALDFDTGMGFELSDIDLRFLEAYNTNLPSELDSRSQSNLEVFETMETSSDPCSPAAIGTEVFRKYYWKFRPNVQDHAAAEEHNLSLPSPAGDHVSPESRISIGKRIMCARLSTSSRDKILNSVMQSCRTENLLRIVESFPAVELLDTLLQYYLTSPVLRADSFLHPASFDPNQKRPELLAAMVAGGAVLTSDPTLCKLGLAIQECLRVAIPRHWERNNTLTRDLELCQSYLIMLEIGLWSGHSRKVEISESFLQPLVTMIRRDGKMKRSGYPALPVPTDEDDEESLNIAWEKWIKLESLKRLTLRIFEHDTISSLSLLVNPLISYAEIHLPLPDSADLWYATNPTEWRTNCTANTNSSLEGPLSLVDYMNDIDRIQSRPHAVDICFSSFAFLSCTWRLSWEYNQIKALQRAGTGNHTWNALLLSSRHEEILKLLGNFRVGADLSGLCSDQIIMRMKLNLMHLHMPFKEIQLFAGMDGLEQARQVYPIIREWVEGESARKAVWHGGQVLRIAKHFQRGAIWGPYAIMIYHASLVLWVYGLLSDYREPISTSDDSGIRGPASNGVLCQKVHLDGSEDILMERFICFGRGLPCIKKCLDHESPSDDVPLHQPSRVMETVVNILLRDYDEFLRPQLVDNLVHLIGGLQKASRGSIGV